MKFTQILISLSALSFLGVTATPAGNPDVPSGPINLPLEAIPAGARIFGLDGNSTLIDPGADDAGPLSRGLTKRNDCNGSGLCSTFRISGTLCSNASGAYDDNAWYCGYTSRVSGSCTAIFTCGDYHGTCWAGWFLKQQFGSNHCIDNPCGSVYFDNGNCRATYNYCSSCKNVG